MTAVWGIHNDALTTELVEQGFVSIAWEKIGNLSQIGPDREALKVAQKTQYPETKPGAVAVQAGTLYRFAFGMEVGDVVVAPYRPNSTINIGVVTGPYQYVAGAAQHPHRRPVQWRKIGIARAVFSQAALNEIGSAITLFSVKKHVAEFLAVINSSGGTTEVDEVAVEQAPAAEVEEPVEEPRVSRVDRFTRDFVLEQLKFPKVQHHEFEQFTAAVLRSLGYQARVNQYSQDGGVGVIAHRDPLGIEPPIVKVQRKHTTATIGGPQVHQLVGTLGANELGVFVTLGTYSNDAIHIERGEQRLRLINGEALVDLVLNNYGPAGCRVASTPPAHSTPCRERL